MTIKKYVLSLVAICIAGQVHADSIKHGGIPNSLSNIIISSLTVSNQATFNGSSVTVMGDFLLNNSTMLTNGTLVISTAISAAATTANVFISTMGTVILSDFSGDTNPNLTLVTPAVSDARFINFRTVEGTDRYSLRDEGSNGLHFRGSAFGIKDDAGNEGLQMTFGSSLSTFRVSDANDAEMFGIDVLGVVRTSQNSNCNTATPGAVGYICTQNSNTNPAWIATGTAAGGYTPFALAASTKSIYFVVVETNVVVANDRVGRIYVPSNGTINNFFCSLSTPPTGSTLLVDINKNNVTVFTTQANRPTFQINSTTTSVTAGNIEVNNVAIDDFFTIDVDQIGSSQAGGRLVCRMDIRPSE